VRCPHWDDDRLVASVDSATVGKTTIVEVLELGEVIPFFHFFTRGWAIRKKPRPRTHFVISIHLLVVSPVFKIQKRYPNGLSPWNK